MSLSRPSILVACLILSSNLTGASAQESPVFKDANRWCVQHHPCDWAGHAVAAGVTSGLLGAATGIDSRWFAAGWGVFFVQKEIRDGLRWGWRGKDASRIAPLPMPLDAGIDMAVTAISALWLAPALERWILGKDRTESGRTPRDVRPGSGDSPSCSRSGCT